MGNVNKLLQERLKKKEKSTKMEKMSKRSATGNLTSFSGVFSITELNDHEKQTIESILLDYCKKSQNISNDLKSLISLTSEVKAITNQAVILHGERIKKAQQILKKYQEGAFTAWLITTYGNRQTPYNFLQYYEFVTAMPAKLRPQIEQMPRQAIYTLASREGPLSKKQKIVENYEGETKHELLCIIRELFPLDESDKRNKNNGETVINTLKKLSSSITRRKLRLSKKQKFAISELLEELNTLISN
ncbi:MAG: CT583 family protein [Chlamydiota bacterium]